MNRTLADLRDAHGYLDMATRCAWQAMMLAAADKPSTGHQNVMTASIDKAIERLGYRMIPQEERT